MIWSRVTVMKSLSTLDNDLYEVVYLYIHQCSVICYFDFVVYSFIVTHWTGKGIVRFVLFLNYFFYFFLFTFFKT